MAFSKTTKWIFSSALLYFLIINTIYLRANTSISLDYVKDFWNVNTWFLEYLLRKKDIYLSNKKKNLFTNTIADITYYFVLYLQSKSIHPNLTLSVFATEIIERQSSGKLRLLTTGIKTFVKQFLS